MTHYYTESDFSLDLIRSRKIAILGYGSQGRSQALNLRDSGLDVTIGLYAGSASAARAESEGFSVMLTEDATRTCDVLMFCVDDVRMRHIFATSVEPWLRPGQALLFSHGFNIHFRLIQPPYGVDVALVSPKGAGPGLRQNFEKGFGVPALIAVHQDATGDALDLALGYAWGIGSARVLMMETTFREETETDLFGEQAVLCGGIPELIRAGYETLVESGYPREAAYFECVHEAKLIIDLLYSRGIAGMRREISDTAEWGGYVAGPVVIDSQVRERMRQVLADIQSGAFTERWLEEDRKGRSNLAQFEREDESNGLEAVGGALRRLMGLQ